jgi:hypothetical protein
MIHTLFWFYDKGQFVSKSRYHNSSPNNELLNLHREVVSFIECSPSLFGLTFFFQHNVRRFPFSQWLEMELKLSPLNCSLSHQSNDSQTNSDNSKHSSHFDSTNAEILELFEKERYLYHQIYDYYLVNEFSDDAHSMATFLLDRLTRSQAATTTTIDCWRECVILFMNIVHTLIHHFKIPLITDNNQLAKIWLLDFFKNNPILQTLTKEDSTNETNSNSNEQKEMEPQVYLDSLLRLVRLFPPQIFFLEDGNRLLSSRSLARVKVFFTSSLYIRNNQLFRSFCLDLHLSFLIFQMLL